MDSVLLSFKMLQRFYLNEVIRGKVGIDTYTLHEEHENEKLDASQIIFESVCRPEDIIDASLNPNIMPFQALNYIVLAECQIMVLCFSVLGVKNGIIQNTKI